MSKVKKACLDCETYQRLLEQESEKRRSAEARREMAEAEARHHLRMYEHSMKRESRLRQMIEEYAAKEGAMRERMSVHWKISTLEMRDFLTDEKLASERSGA